MAKTFLIASLSSSSNFINERSLVAIIGENNDLLEIPLLMLNNPITIIT